MSAERSTPRERRCEGYSEYTGNCPNQAGPNPYWCPRCDKLRLEYLDGQFAKITEQFERLASGR